MDERCGRWLLGRVIATGAWAEVRAARAHDAAVGDAAEPVAIKRQHDHAARDPAFHQLFAAECALTRSLPPHPALISAIAEPPEPADAGAADDAVPAAARARRAPTAADGFAPRPYLVMPHIDGPDLRARLAGGAMARAEVLAVAAAIAGGLAHLHGQGWVHGDVNPANILLGPSGAVLCDLGVARRAGEPGPVRGTAAYMAPEQVKGEPWTTAVDVFALGVVLWELSAGARLFARPASYLAMAAVVESTPPVLEDAGLAPLVTAALSPAPTARPTAAELAAALAALR